MESQTPDEGTAPADSAASPPPQDPRLSLWLMLGERQYLMTKLAAEMSAIVKRIDEVNQQAEPAK